MNSTRSNIPENRLRKLFVFAAVVLIVLTSCAVKGSIKSLAGIPTNTEQGIAKNNQSLLGNTSETCAIGEITDAEISPVSSFSLSDLLPAVIFAVVFIFLSGFISRKEQSHPLYGSLKIPAALPLFLLYRKLIVHHSI